MKIWYLRINKTAAAQPPSVPHFFAWNIERIWRQQRTRQFHKYPTHAKSVAKEGLEPLTLVAGPQRENFPVGTKVDTGPQILLGPQALSGAHAVKSFFVRWVYIFT